MLTAAAADRSTAKAVITLPLAVAASPAKGTRTTATEPAAEGKRVDATTVGDRYDEIRHRVNLDDLLVFLSRLSRDEQDVVFDDVRETKIVQDQAERGTHLGVVDDLVDRRCRVESRFIERLLVDLHFDSLFAPDLFDDVFQLVLIQVEADFLVELLVDQRFGTARLAQVNRLVLLAAGGNFTPEIGVRV